MCSSDLAARNFAELFVARLGVGVGEATCAPACASLIGDLFPPARRARALAVFMMGLPIGIGMSYAVSGTVAQAWGWRSAFFLAFLPGLACALLSLYIPEPERGGAETHSVGARQRDGSPYLLVLSIPTLWWIIASGALHNFNMYALGTFLSPMLERYHHVNTAQAGFIAMATYGLAGVPGLWIGGQLADIAIRRAHSGRMLVGGVAILLSTPLLYLALARPAGDLAGFLVLMALGCGLMYIYYATVYATIQDVVEPSLRGTAMALYFFAMYVLGASLGPYLMGAASDHFALAAAAEAGISVPSAKDLEPVYRSLGLHRAMFLVPSLSAVLAAVLFAGAATVKRDMERLQSWMRGERTAEPRE